MFVVEPQGSLWFRYDWSKDGKLVPDGFKYTSDNNTEWLSEDQIRALIKPFEEAYKEGVVT
jgi:UDP-N-acetylglucosamine 4,6-dehydratase